jgi:hypothetical protein
MIVNSEQFDDNSSPTATMVVTFDHARRDLIPKVPLALCYQ